MKMEVDFSKAATFIREKKAELVLLQIPEGLKHRAKELAQALERKSGAQVITLLDPNYGSCDIADDKAILTKKVKQANHNMLYVAIALAIALLAGSVPPLVRVIILGTE